MQGINLASLLFFYIPISGAISHSTVPGEIRLALHALLSLTITLFFIYTLPFKRYGLKLSRYHFAIIIFSLLAAFSIIINREGIGALFWGIQYFYWAMSISFIMSLTMPPKYGDRVMTLLMGYALFSAFTGLLVIISPVDSIFLFNIQGVFTDRNLAVRFYCIVSIFFLLKLIRVYETEKRVSYSKLFVLTILFIHTLLLLSRSGYLLYFISIVGTALLSGNKTFKRAILGVAPFIFIAFLIMTSIRVRQDKMDVVNASDMTRITLLKAGANMIKARPLFGVGYYTSQRKFKEYQDIHAPSLIPVTMIHNIFVAYWAEMGIFGLLVYLYLNFSLILRLFKKWRIDPKNEDLTLTVALSLSLFMIHGLVYHSFDDTASYWIVLALGITIIHPPKLTENSHG